VFPLALLQLRQGIDIRNDQSAFAVVFQGAQGVGGAKAGYEHAEGVVVVLLQGFIFIALLFKKHHAGVTQVITQMKLVLPAVVHIHKPPVGRADPARGIVYKHKRPGVVAAGRNAATAICFKLLPYFCS